jgi:O-antigen ligase
VATRSGQRRRGGAPTKSRPARPVPAQSRAVPNRRPPGRARRRQQPAPSLPAWLSTDGLLRLSDTSGIPGWAIAAGALAWLIVLLVWASGATRGSFAVFLGVVLSAFVGFVCLTSRALAGKQPLRALRTVGVMLLGAALPTVFDPHSGDVFNLPKYTVLVVTALAIAGLWVISGVHERRLPAWRNGLQWIIAAMVVWSLVSALAGMDTHVGLLGNYGSYDGWYEIAAFAVLTTAAAEALEARDVRRAAGAVAFCGGTVVVVYGLIQLHDYLLGGGKWDFIKWNLGSFSNDIFSTFGNPNHLGGYLAALLPLALVLGLGARRWPWRILAGLFVVALLAELLRTSARGAWVGAVVALVVLGLYLAPEIRHRPAQAFGGAGVVVAVAAAVMATKGSRFLGHSLSTLFQSGGNTSVEQRFEIWTVASKLALHHPATGIGPDVFALLFPRYQSAKWVAGLGPNYLVNGAHDIFMNYLADQGFIGALLFVALVVFAAFRSVGAWRRFRGLEKRELEKEESTDAAARDEARNHRFVLAAVSASMAAYLVQAVFNVQQVGLSMIFWLMLGLLLVLATSAGVPDTLSPAALLSARPQRAGETAPAEAAVAGQVPRRPALRPRPSSRRRQEVPWPTLAVGAAVTAAVAFLAVGADAPYRADHDYWAAYNSLGLTGASTKATTKAPTNVTQTYFTDMKNAISLNPWEATYPYQEASVMSSISQHSSSPSEQLSYMTQARSLYAKAVADEPLWAPYPAGEAGADVEMANLVPAQAVSYLAEAKSLALLAIKDNPRDAAYHALLSSVERDLRRAETVAAKAKAKAKAH